MSAEANRPLPQWPAAPLRYRRGDALGGEDGKAQFLRESRHVDLGLPLPGQVAHVEHEDRRQPQIEDLAHQKQVALDVGGVDDAQDGVDATYVRLPAEQDVDRDHFVGRTGSQAVRPRQIDQPRRRLAEADAADFFLDGDAGIVPHAALHAGQRIEQRALAGVRITDQGDGDRSRLGGCGRGKDHAVSEG